jgi:hypothetical protein
MESFAYFPTLVYRDERPDFIGQVLPLCNARLDEVRSPDYPVCQSGHLGRYMEARELSDYLLVSATEILRSQGYAVEKYDFSVQGLWAQEVKRGGGTNVHVHKNSQICGWFFLDAVEGAAYPVYHDTRMNKAMVELDFEQGGDVNAATNSIHFNNIVPGTVLFSNSWVNHQLVGSNSEAPMKCIHFIITHKDKPCSTC